MLDTTVARKLINGVIQSMNKKITFLLAVTFLFLFSGSSVVFGDDYKNRFDAYQREDYKEAVRLLLPIAEQGYPWAQALVGMMYDNGHGVLQDYKEAVTCYRLAAEQGNELAQSPHYKH
jgi:TPR repeat protein